MDKILQKKSLAQWLKQQDSYDIYAPLFKDGIWSYEIVENSEEMKLEHPNTVQAPKKIIFPQKEVLLEFSTSDEKKPDIKETLPKQNPSIILGVRPCDARAVTLHDKVFGDDIKDPYYWARRNQVVIAGLACNTPPSPNCFCLSVEGSPHSTEGLDLLMTDLGDTYYIQSLTEKGEDLLKSSQELLQNASRKDKEQAENKKAESEKKIKRQINNLKALPPKLKGMFDSPLWDEEAMGCLRCGICTYLCPTCHCFDITDELTSSNPAKGQRVRSWDTCQFPDFTMHSSGHNPRPDKASRLRQRIMHKFQYFVENFQNYQCTGCGRCVSLCPVGIDIIEVLNKVSEHG